MSVEPRNGLWNRLLARAEARAREGTRPEPHHYRPVSVGDDHLRASLENSLVYHGLKIETEFNLRLQRPPRKRKAKRKGDLPVAERLRNDRAASGSPGPSHRTPTGTPARRISKTTPLSRPPLPPAPPLPPIPATTRAAAARERVLNTVSDDDDDPPASQLPELSDSGDDCVILAQATKPDGAAVIVLPHFDQAANSNDTSSWEDDAILVQQPPKEGEQDSGENNTKSPRRGTTPPSELSPVLDVGPELKTCKRERERERSARTRKIASSDSSPAPNSDSGKNRSRTYSADERERPTMESERCGKVSESPKMNTQLSIREKKGLQKSKPKGEKFKQKNISENGNASKNNNNDCTPCTRNTLVGESLAVRLKDLTEKEPKGRVSSPRPTFLLGSSEEERPAPSRRPCPPMRAVPARRRTPPDVSVEDKLFGPLSPLNSPRRRTRNTPGSEGCITISDGDSSLMEVTKGSCRGRENSRESWEVRVSPRSGAKRRSNAELQIPTRKSPRRSPRNRESERRNCELEVISAGPSEVKAAPRKQDNKSTSPEHSGPHRKTVRKSAPRNPSADTWEDALSVHPVNVEVLANLSSKTRRRKSPPSSSLSGSSDDSDKGNGKTSNMGTKKRTKSHLIRIKNLSLADEDSSDDESKYIVVQRTKSRPLKRKRTLGPASKAPDVTPKPDKPIQLQRKSSLAKTKRMGSSNDEKKADSVDKLQEVCDSDSDVVIVSFSPAKGKGRSNGNAQNRERHDVSGQENAKKASNCGNWEITTSTSDDSDESPTSKSRTRKNRTVRTSSRCKIQPRMRRPIKSQTRTGQLRKLADLDVFSQSWLDSDKEAEDSAKKGETKGESGRKERRGDREAMTHSSDDSDIVPISNCRTEDKRTVRTSPRCKVPVRIRRPIKSQSRAGELRKTSEWDGELGNCLGMSWFDSDKSAEDLAKRETRRVSRRQEGERGKKERRNKRECRVGSSSGAETSDSGLFVDVSCYGKDDSKERCRKKRRKK